MTRIIGPLFLAAATVPFLAEGGNRQAALAQAVDPPKATKDNSDSSINSKREFFSLDFNKDTKKYIVRIAKEESIAKYLKEQEGANKSAIDSELELVWLIQVWINKKIAPLDHELLPLKEINEPIPEVDENDPRVFKPVEFLLSRRISLIESIPQKFLGDVPVVVSVDLSSVAIRSYGKEREKVLSFKEVIPKKFEEPNGEKFERMVVYPLNTRLIITQGDYAYFVNVK